MTHGNAHLSRHALRQKCFAGPHGAADQIAHRQGFGIAALEQLGIFPQTLLDRRMAHQNVHGPLGLDEFEQAPALAFDQFLFQHPHPFRIQAMARFEGGLNHDVHIHEGNPGSEAGEFAFGVVGYGAKVAPVDGVLQEALARRLIRHGNFDVRDVGVRGDAFTESRGAFIDQNHGHVQPLHVRAGGPVEQRDDLLRGRGTQAAGLAAGDQEGRVVDQNGRADAFLAGHDVVLHEAVEQGECGGWILARRCQVADLLVRANHHLFKPRAVASGESTQTARQIVVQHQIPPAEYLLGEEVGEAAVGTAVFGERHEVVHVAVQDE